MASAEGARGCTGQRESGSGIGAALELFGPQHQNQSPNRKEGRAAAPEVLPNGVGSQKNEHNREDNAVG